MLNNIWKKRLHKHFSERSKQLKLIANDHFILLLLGLFVIASIGYANLLKWPHLQQFKLAFLIGGTVLSVLGFHFVRLVTFIHKQDTFYLRYFELEIPNYLKKSFYYSAFMPIIGFSLFWGMLMPLLRQLNVDSTIINLVIFYNLVILKLFNEYCIYTGKCAQTSRYWFYGLAFFAILSSFFVWWISVICVSLLWFVSIIIAKKIVVINWDELIINENIRLQRQQKFLSLFINTPNLQIEIKQNWLLNALFIKTDNPYLYQYQKIFLRNASYWQEQQQFIILFVLISLIIKDVFIYFLFSLFVQWLLIINYEKVYLKYRYHLYRQLLPFNQTSAKAFVTALNRFTMIQLIVMCVMHLINWPILTAIVLIGGVIGGKIAFFRLYVLKKIVKING